MPNLFLISILNNDKNTVPPGTQVERTGNEELKLAKSDMLTGNVAIQGAAS
jgi:hypothetical protein